MQKTMKMIAITTCVLTAFFILLYVGNVKSIFLTFSIIFGTTAYHFCIRLAIGTIYNHIMKNQADYTRPWFRQRKWVPSLYKKLKVKKWKDRMLTYAPDVFDTSKHSLEEIIQAMCQSELVHETCFIFSFVPVIFIPVFGAPVAFIVTSCVAACVELAFVVMQRYNRPRILRLLEK